MSPLAGHGGLRRRQPRAALILRNHYINRDFGQRQRAAGQGRGMGPRLHVRLASGKVHRQAFLGYGRGCARASWGSSTDSSRGPPQHRAAAVRPATATRPVDDYSGVGLTGKVRVSKSMLRLGTTQPILTAVVYNDTRLLSFDLSGGLADPARKSRPDGQCRAPDQGQPADSSGRDDIRLRRRHQRSLGLRWRQLRHCNPAEPALATTTPSSEQIYRQQAVVWVYTWPLGERLEPAQLTCGISTASSDGADRSRKGRRTATSMACSRCPRCQGTKFTATWQQIVRRQSLRSSTVTCSIRGQPGDLQHLHPRRAGFLARCVTTTTSAPRASLA